MTYSTAAGSAVKGHGEKSSKITPQHHGIAPSEWGGGICCRMVLLCLDCSAAEVYNRILSIMY